MEATTWASVNAKTRGEVIGPTSPAGPPLKARGAHIGGPRSRDPLCFVEAS